MYYSKRKKQRGQERRLRALCREIDGLEVFANTNRTYENFRVGNLFIGHPKTYSHIKTAFCRKIIEKTEQIIAEKPEGLPFCKVVAIIFPLELLSSKITIFYDEDFYHQIITIKVPGTVFTEIEDESRSFAKERNIKTVLAEKGFINRFPSWNGLDEQEMWILGEV